MEAVFTEFDGGGAAGLLQSSWRGSNPYAKHTSRAHLDLSDRQPRKGL